MSVIAYPLEATEYTAADAQTYLSTRKSGVYSDEITFTPEGMTVTVSPFLAWLNYAQFKGCSVAVTEPETLTFSPAHAVLDRIDRVVLRLDLTTNRAYLTVLEGEPSSNAVAPQISKTEIINDISPIYVKIKAGATEITDADITSTILDENVCGIMRDGVTGIPTAQLQEQVEELIAYLDRAIKETEGNSAFMMADIYDPNRKAEPVVFSDDVPDIVFPVGAVFVQHKEAIAPPFIQTGVVNGSWIPLKVTKTVRITQYFTFADSDTTEIEFDISSENLVNPTISALGRAGVVDRLNISVSSTQKNSIDEMEKFSLKVKSKDKVAAWVYITVSGTSDFDENDCIHWKRVS